MIRPELHFEAVGRGAVGTAHDARIVEKHVEASVVCEEGLREAANALERAEVQCAELEVGAGHLLADPRGGRFVLLDVSGRHDDRSALRGQRPRADCTACRPRSSPDAIDLERFPLRSRGLPEQAVARALPGEVDALQDLVGGRIPAVTAHC